MLTKTELERLLPLIHRHGHGGFSAADEAELRRIVAKEYPDHARRLDVETLMGLTKSIVGLAAILAREDAKAHAEA